MGRDDDDDDDDDDDRYGKQAQTGIPAVVIAVIAIVVIGGLGLAFLRYKGGASLGGGGNEVAAIGSLKTLSMAQTLFREGDKDGNGALDYANDLPTLVLKSPPTPRTSQPSGHGHVLVLPARSSGTGERRGGVYPRP
ncbi:MAG: hypothetical protein JKY65_21265, partial [Planctomycetes bacterium]|nr:hypothetical protein [Planctomycetota bacterium]